MKQVEENKTTYEVLSHRNIRRAVGLLGIVLPFALIGFSLFFGCQQIQPSISQYFYTSAGILFVGVLCAVGLFLITYKGPQRIDDYATNFAGACALGIAFFPTDVDHNRQCLLFVYHLNPAVSVVHYICSALFFASLAANSYFLFTRSDTTLITEQKQTRNQVYRTCGILMVIFAALIPISHVAFVKQYIDLPYSTLILEALALLTFGISWLIKGETFITDEADAKMVRAKKSDVVSPTAE